VLLNAAASVLLARLEGSASTAATPDQLEGSASTGWGWRAPPQQPIVTPGGHRLNRVELEGSASTVDSRLLEGTASTGSSC